MFHHEKIIYLNKLYNVGDTLVYSGLYGNTHAIIKIITNSPNYGIRHKTLREITSLKKFKCDSIVKLLGVKYIVNDQEDITILIYENCGQSLNRIDPFKIDAKSAIKDISRGLKYIHKLGYIHGDLNISNVTQCDENTFKIIDFGNCTKIYRLSAISMPTPCITPIEMLNFKNLTNVTGIDSWALGCLAYHITTGTPLFVENTIEDLRKEIMLKFETYNPVRESVKTQMLKHIKFNDDINFVKQTSKLFNNNSHKRSSVMQFYKGVYKSKSEDKLCEKHSENFDMFKNCTTHVNRSFMMDMLIHINTENALPIENVFITFELVDTHIPKFDYKTDVILLYSLVTKIICNSHFPMTNIVEMLKKISDENVNTVDVNKKIGIILEHYCWDLDVKTLMAYLPEIDLKFKKIYIVICTFVTYLSKYVGYSNYYKKKLICHILNMCCAKKNPVDNKIKVKNHHTYVSQTNHMLKLLRENINNEVIIGYFKAVNLSSEYDCLKLYLLNDISKCETSME